MTYARQMTDSSGSNADENIGTRRLDEPPDPDELTYEEQQELVEPEHDVQPVSYSGTDFDVEGLVRRLNRGDIVIPTFGHEIEPPLETARFQRGFVWRRPQMDKFIESLLLGYPIPGIILVQQADRRYQVLDGQQRVLERSPPFTRASMLPATRFAHEGVIQDAHVAASVVVTVTASSLR